MVDNKRKGRELTEQEILNKITKEEMEELKTIPQYKWDEVKEIINKQWKFPDNKDRTILVLDENDLQAISSKERLKIVYLLRRKKFNNIQEIIKELGRDPAAVSRDISILERIGIVKKIREGKTVRIVPSADMVILPIIQKDLLQMLEETAKGKDKDAIDNTIETLEQLWIMNLIYEKIMPQLDEKMRGHKNLTLMLTAMVLQELKGMPDRLVNLLRTMPDECWTETVQIKECQVSHSKASPHQG